MAALLVEVEPARISLTFLHLSLFPPAHLVITSRFCNLWILLLIKLFAAAAPAAPSGVWGSHLNMKVVKSSAPSNFQKLSTKLALQATTSITRKSLKKKGKKSTSFFDTLGDSQSSMDVASFPIRSLSTPLPFSHHDDIQQSLPASTNHQIFHQKWRVK